ncbi:MAG TPA: hypothetical protein VGC27_10180 [Rhizomicrobium sp.]
MPLTPNLPVGVEPTLDELRAGAPEVIDETWKDDIVNRLLLQLKRQLCQLENTKPTTEIDQANIRATNVKTLASIERTLDRLLQMEQQRALARETKVAAKNDGALAKLERRINLLIAASNPQESVAAPEK